MMPYVLLHFDLFGEGEADRSDSEYALLWLLESVTLWNCRFLERNPKTPKLYDSGVVYAIPEQMAECKIPESKLNDCVRYLRKLGAGEDTIDAIVAFLRGVEVFRDIPTIIAKGSVDCDNLACWRAAELRNAGVKASPYITWRERPDGTTYHALVRWPDGTSECPSLLLGMGGAAKDDERAEERRKNRERFDTLVETARRLCDAGVTDMPTVGAQITSLGLLPKAGWK